MTRLPCIKRYPVCLWPCPYAKCEAQGAAHEAAPNGAPMYAKEYRQVRAGTLEGDFRTPTGGLKLFFQGGALGINLMMSDLWQLVLGGFWNHIFGNQEYDPRTPSFWSLSVVKKRSQQLHRSKTRNLTNSIIRLLPLLPCQSPFPISNPP